MVIKQTENCQLTTDNRRLSIFHSTFPSNFPFQFPSLTPKPHGLPIKGEVPAGRRGYFHFLMLHIVPYCGLGNRLNMITSAISLAKNTDHEVAVLWDRTPDCYAWFDELFLPIPGLRIERLSHFYQKAPGKSQLWLPRLMRRFMYDRCLKARKLEGSSLAGILEELPKEAKIYIEGNRPFCSQEGWGLIKPAAAIAQRVEKFAAQYGPYTVGVHIRRTDHKEVMAHNPLERYLSLMDAELQQHPEVRFYIASDDPVVKALLHQRYPGRILMLEGLSLDRHALQGMHDSVLELFCLARTHHIIGSTGSTYSDLAQKLAPSCATLY